MSFLSPLEQKAPSSAKSHKMCGVHLAIVAENTEGNGNPGGQVKVSLPWLDEEQKSTWARIAVPMAGAERGTYVLPEVGDQLLVVFEHGDVSRPIVIGAAWSKKQEPPENNETGKNNTKLIKSRCGHRVIFDDKEGEEKVIIVDKTKKNQIVLDTKGKLLKIECAGDITIKAKENVIVHSKTLKMGTVETLKLGGQQMLVHTNATFGFKAGSEITVSGSQITANVANSPACQVSGAGEGELGGIAEEKAKDQQQAQAGAAGGGGAGAGGGGGGGGGGAGGGGGRPGSGSSGGGGGGGAGYTGTSSGNEPAPSSSGGGGGRIVDAPAPAAAKATGARGNTRPQSNNTFEQARTSDDVGKGAGKSAGSEDARNNPDAGSGKGGTFEQARTSRDVGKGAGKSGASEDARGGPGAGAGDSADSEDARTGPGAGAGDGAASEDARGGPGAGAGDSAASEDARGGVGAGAGDSAASEDARGGPGAGAGTSAASEDARGGPGAGAGTSGASEDARGGPGAGAGASAASENARSGPGAGAGTSGASEDARGGPGAGAGASAASENVKLS